VSGVLHVPEQLARCAGGAHGVDVEAGREPLILPCPDQPYRGVWVSHGAHVDRRCHGHRRDHGLDAWILETVQGLVVEAYTVDPAREREFVLAVLLG
jgi:hypothetical protein